MRFRVNVFAKKKKRAQHAPDPLSIAFGTLPSSGYIQGSPYRVTFNRIVTPRLQREERRTWRADEIQG